MSIQVADPQENPPVVFDAGRLDTLLELASGEGLEFVKEIVRQFDEDTAVLMQRLEVSVAENDFRRVADAAHSLRGSASIFGLSRTEHGALHLESAARNFNRDEVIRWHSWICNALPAGRRELEIYLDWR